MEDCSPYMRTGKQNLSAARGRGTMGTRDVVEDLSDDVWNFMSFCKKDFVKDSVPDQQLSLQELTLRYRGEFTDPVIFDLLLIRNSSLKDGVNALPPPAGTAG